MKRKKNKKITYESLTPDLREILQKYNILKYANPSKAREFITWMKSVLAWKKGRGRKPPHVHFDVIPGGKKEKKVKV